MLRSRAANSFRTRLLEAPVFAGCTSKQLDAIEGLVTQISRPAGYVMTRQGFIGNECFVLLKGEAVVERNGALIAHADSGSVLGELALMGEPTRTATVIATTDVDLLAMSRREFSSLRALRITSVEHHLTAVAAERGVALAQRIASEPCEVSEQRTA